MSIGVEVCTCLLWEKDDYVLDFLFMSKLVQENKGKFKKVYVVLSYRTYFRNLHETQG